MLIASGVQAQNVFATTGSSILGYTLSGTQSTFASGLTNVGGGMAFDSAGNLFASSGGGDIIKFTPGGLQSVFATGLQGPAGVAFDSAGNLFVGNTTGYYGATITKITPAGVQSTFTSVQQSAIDDPVALAFNRAGNLFVAEDGDGDIMEYTPSGVPNFFATHLGFDAPLSVAFDSAGNLFTTGRIPNDPYLHGDIYKITPEGTVSVFASGLYDPTALVIDSADDVFVVAGVLGIGDRNEIFEFTPNGVQSTFATTDGMYVSLAISAPEPSVLELFALGFCGIVLLRARQR